MDWQDVGGVHSTCVMRENRCLRMKFKNFDLTLYRNFSSDTEKDRNWMNLYKWKWRWKGMQDSRKKSLWSTAKILGTISIKFKRALEMVGELGQTHGS